MTNLQETGLAAHMEHKVLRVAYPIQEKLTEIDENGNYTGYTYEYLQEIAQYTGWEYEFVQIPGEINDSLTKMLDMVAAGEIDLMGGIIYNDELAKTYDYPGSSYGTAYSVLQVLPENTEINEGNYQTFSNMRIAVMKKATRRNAELAQFCEMNGITPELIVCDNEQKQMEALRSDAADAMLGVDLVNPDGMRTLAKFAPRPYYFITTKGNSEIISELNTAILNINEADPYFCTKLYEKHFNIRSNMTLTRNELDYIAQAGQVRIGVEAGKAPIQSYNERTGKLEGITAGILHYITEQTNLDFEIVPANGFDELMELAEEGRISAISAVPYHYETAEEYDVALTKPYTSAQVIMAIRKGMNPANLNDKRLALAKGIAYPKSNTTNVIWYETPEECLRAVDNDEADYTYVDGYIAQHYTNQSRLGNITLIPQPGDMNEYCIGAVEPADTRLLTIINKAIANISQERLQTITNSNIIMQPEQITWGAFISSNPIEVMSVIVIVAAGVMALILVYVYRKAKADRRQALQNERYVQLYDMSNEYIFEYDFEEDKLTLSEKSAQFFECERVMKNFFEQSEELFCGETVSKQLLSQIKQDGSFAKDIEVQLSNARFKWVRVNANVIYSKENVPILAVGKIIDIHEEHEEKERLVEKAQKDGLTGAYNAATTREYISEHVENMQAVLPGVMIVADIDHFKVINDKFGHPQGDKVLQKTVDILQSVFGADSFIGRMGGDEFVAFLEDASDRNNLEEKCNLLVNEIKKMDALDQKHLVTISVGAVIVKKGQHYMDVYRLADEALYRVKKNGRDGFEIYG
ncbi:MAG: transporter substrate-binding domain-containing protein [Christensenella sp.]